VRGVPERDLAAATEALVARYRSVAPASAPILASTAHVAGYAAYRMPATHAAVARVLTDVTAAVSGSGLEPQSQLDLGGGTGAAAWAAAGAFPAIDSITVLDQVGGGVAARARPRGGCTCRVAEVGAVRGRPRGRMARDPGRPRDGVLRPQRADRSPAGLPRCGCHGPGPPRGVRGAGDAGRLRQNPSGPFGADRCGVGARRALSAWAGMPSGARGLVSLRRPGQPFGRGTPSPAELTTCLVVRGDPSRSGAISNLDREVRGDRRAT
jgi:hypothetical protein